MTPEQIKRVQWWNATYCTDGESDTLSMMGSMPAIKSWVEKINADRRVRTDVWGHHTYHGANHLQFGTNYLWLHLVPHVFEHGERRPVEAYSSTTGKHYPTWDDLVAAETSGWVVTAVITRGAKTWPWVQGTYPDKAEANKAKARLMRKYKKTEDQYPGTTYTIHARPVWKDPRDV